VTDDLFDSPFQLYTFIEQVRHIVEWVSKWEHGLSAEDLAKSCTKPLMVIVPHRPWLHCPNARWNRRREDLNSSPLGELQDTTRTPSYCVDADYPARPEIQKTSPCSRRGSELSTL